MSDNNEKKRQIKEMAEKIWTKTAAYHQHKEIMAHAGLAAEIALVTVVLVFDFWLGISRIFILLIWLIIHIYMRWQLRCRRWAAIRVQEFESRLCQWSICKWPADTDLNDYNCSAPKPCRYFWLDYIFPIFTQGIPLDKNDKGKPQGLVVSEEELKFNTETDWIQKDKNLYYGEWSITIASFLIFAILLHSLFIEC